MNIKLKSIQYGSILFAISIMFLLISNTSASTTQSCNLISTSNYFKIIGVNWGNSTHMVSAGPGLNDVPLTVTLENYGGSCSFIDLKGYLELYGGVSNFNGSSYSTYYLNTLQPYSIFNMVFYLNIAKNTSAGKDTILSYPFYISWNYTNETIRSTQEYNLSIPLRGNPDLSFSVEDQPLIAGELNNITLNVKNSGTGYASNISPSVSISGASVITQPETIGYLAPNSAENVSFYAYLSSSSSGQPINIDMNYNFVNPYGYNTSSTTQIGTYAIPNYNNGISVSLLNESITSGGVQNTSIVAYDSSNYPIKNLSITLSPGSGISLIGSDGILKFPEITPHTSLSVPISLYLAPSSSTVGSITATLAYVINGEPETSTVLLNALTPGSIDLTDMNTVILPSIPSPGSSFTLTSTLDNIGSQSASSVSITPKTTSGITVEGENTTSLGNIPVDSPTAFTLSFLVSQSLKPGIYNIPISISYLNNLNQFITQTMIFPVNISNTKTSFVSSAGAAGSGVVYNSTQYASRYKSGGVPILLIIIIIIIICVIIYYFYRKRKLSKKTKAHQ